MQDADDRSISVYFHNSKKNNELPYWFMLVEQWAPTQKVLEPTKNTSDLREGLSSI